MMMLSDIATAASGQVFGNADVTIRGICTDSRQDCSECLFVAIDGDNFDGHDYIAQAANSGAAAMMLNRELDSTVPSVVVEDTMKGMAALTKKWRQRFDVPVVAITGSVGKTSLKEMIGSILSIEKNGIVTKGNFNNEIGVPLTVTRLDDSHEFAVIEMGMNHFGEIARLSEMTQPTIAVINNAAAAHLENLETIAGVAKAKGEIVKGLAADGVLVINADDEFAEYWSDLAGSRRVVRFGLSETADVTAHYTFDESGTDLSVHYFDQKFDLRIPVIGKHNVMNVLASIAVTKELAISNETLQTAFDRHTPPKDRAGRYQIAGGVLIDDSYNANPTSMASAIDQLHLEQSLNREIETILVLGDMGELGVNVKELHRQVGEAAVNKVDHVYAVGHYASAYAAGFGRQSKVFEAQSDLINKLEQDLVDAQEKNIELRILVKGSRTARMDKIVSALQSEVQQ